MNTIYCPKCNEKSIGVELVKSDTEIGAINVTFHKCTNCSHIMTDAEISEFMDKATKELNNIK